MQYLIKEDGLMVKRIFMQHMFIIMNLRYIVRYNFIHVNPRYKHTCITKGIPNLYNDSS